MSEADTPSTVRITGHEMATLSTTTTPYQPSPLLRLPPELRNHIYMYALYQGDIRLFTGWTINRSPTEKPGLEILRTCRQIHTEASQIVYSVNTFEFQWTFDIPRFARSLTAHNLNAVSSIRLQRDSIRSLIGGQGGVDAVHTLPSLERLHVRGYVWGPEWDELAMTRLRTDGKSISIFAD